MKIQRGGEVKKIGDLFEKYKRTLRAPQGIIVDAFIEVVGDLVGIEIPKERISYSVHNKTLTTQISGPLKTEILLKKEEILMHMKGRIGEQSVPKEIR
ncbi:MAG: hypothetical protein ACI92I_000290 [Acidimicrobiales bacterium]|jgi:hypothetical protein